MQSLNEIFTDKLRKCNCISPEFHELINLCLEQAFVELELQQKEQLLTDAKNIINEKN